MTDQVTLTPHAVKMLRKHIREWIEDMRSDIRMIRELRAKGGVLALEDAEGMSDMLWHKHKVLWPKLRTLSTCKVEKYSNLSPKAAARMKALRG